MEKIKIISDSSCDLTASEIKELDVDVVPFLVSYDGEKYNHDGVEQTYDEFYNIMIENPKYRPKSACPLMGDYLDLFEKYAKENISVICVCLTSKFSGSYNSALNAREMVLEDYPNSKITVIDSELITVIQGMYVKQIRKMIDLGLSYDDIILKAEEIKKTGRVIFTIGTMEYLNKGGRIGKVAMVLASKAQIRPIIFFKDGDISAKGVALGRKRSIMKTIEKIKDYFKNGKHNVEDYEFAVGYGSDIEEGKKFLDTVHLFLSSLSDKIMITLHQIGSTIAVHTGPYPLGLGFIKKFDK